MTGVRYNVDDDDVGKITPEIAPKADVSRHYPLWCRKWCRPARGYTPSSSSLFAVIKSAWLGITAIILRFGPSSELLPKNVDCCLDNPGECIFGQFFLAFCQLPSLTKALLAVTAQSDDSTTTYKAGVKKIAFKVCFFCVAHLSCYELGPDEFYGLRNVLASSGKSSPFEFGSLEMRWGTLEFRANKKNRKSLQTYFKSIFKGAAGKPSIQKSSPGITNISIHGWPRGKFDYKNIS